MRQLALGLTLLLASCTSIVGPVERREVGVIPGLAAGAAAIEIPSVVKAGEEFTITITTTWHDGCSRKGETEVDSDGVALSVTPYDFVTVGGLCPQQPQMFTHTATLLFPSPGIGEIIVRGRSSPRAGGITEFERMIRVE